MNSPHDALRIQIDGAVATITLDNPAELNAVSTPMLDALTETVERLGHDDDVRVIALTGEGRGFCSGASLNGADTSTLQAVGRTVLALRDCPKTTVALVNGIAAGVGVSLALVCDYSLARSSAAFMLAFTKIGLMPDGGSTALVAASIGRARALRMALTAEKVPAPTAAEWGLVAEVVADDDFAARGAELCAGFAAAAPLGMAATAAAITAASVDLEAALAREEAGQTRLLDTEDFAEGVAAFTEKRTARFVGR